MMLPLRAPYGWLQGFLLALGLASFPHSLTASTSIKTSVGEEEALYLAQKGSSVQLYVESSVKGAEVLVDGILAGRVNSYLVVSPGMRIIRVFHNEYFPYEHRMKMEAGKTYKMKVRLKKKPTPQEKAAAAKQKQAAQKPAPAAAPSLLAPSAADQAQAPPPAAQPSQNYSSQVAPRAGKGAAVKRRSKKRSKPRVQRNGKSKKSSPLFATQPQERDSTDYALSFLPLGLPQMRHDKPALGTLMLAMQVGGVGAWFYFNNEAKTMVETRDQTIKTAKTHIDSLPQGKSRSDKTKTLSKYHNDANAEIAQFDQFALFSMIAAISGYGFSVLEALVVGPKVKTPADFWTQNHTQPGTVESCFAEDLSQGLYSCLEQRNHSRHPVRLRLAFSRLMDQEPWYSDVDFYWGVGGYRGVSESPSMMVGLTWK